jgi:UPF0716 family protein affecting phage T7 exclusion
MDLTPFFIVALPVTTILAVGLLGSTRRIGFWAALILAILLTPVGGFIVALISGRGRRKPKRRQPEQ